MIAAIGEVARDEKTSYLTQGGAHHSLIYIEAGEGALDHVSLEARDESALHELNDRLAKHGVRLIEHEREPAVKQSIRFEGPDGHVFEVFTGMAQDQRGDTRPALHAGRFRHLV